MVDQRLSRIRVLCPNKHEVITRKHKNIQCRKCGIRFTVEVKTDSVLADMAKAVSVS